MVDGRRLIFYREDVDRINRVLEEYNKLANAKCQLLIDKDGHSISRVGAQTSFDEDTLAALVAGSFAATRAIAKLLGEEEFTLLSQQGERDHVQLGLVGDRCMLVTLFDDRATVGLVRLYGGQAQGKLRAILQEIAERPDLGLPEGPGDEPGGAGVFARLRPRPIGPGGAHARPETPGAE